MSRHYLIPTSGEDLPHPNGVLPAAGGYVDEIDHFWRRRLADQDVITGRPPKAEPEPKTSAAPAASTATK